MRLSLRSKLAIASAAVALSLCAAIYLSVRNSFTEGFYSYLMAGRIQAAQQLATAIAENHPNLPSWQRFTRSPRYFDDLQRAIQSPGNLGLSAEPGLDKKHRPPRDKPPRTRPPRGPFILLDTERRPLFRRAAVQADWPLVPIQVDATVVGYIGVAPARENTDLAAAAFVADQNRRFSAIALASALIIILLSWPLARWLTRPVAGLSDHIRSLARRDYSARAAAAGNDEFGQLARELNALAATLESYEQRQQHWVSDISHELRTPLAILQAQVEAAEDGIRPLDRAWLSAIRLELEQLTQLVSDLGDSMAAGDGQSLQLSPLDLGELVEQQIRQFSASLHRQQLNFELVAEEPALITADTAAMTRVIRNLVQNSLRYTDSPGQILCTLERSAGTVELRWEDSAPGVDSGQLPSLFQRLYRVDSSRNRQRGGSGLGLAIVQSIVDQHHGRVHAALSPLGGLAIVMELPIEQAVNRDISNADN